MAVILGVDVGTVRVGCAVADDQVRIPFPVAIWAKAQGAAERELLRTIQERGASTVVIGLPLGMNGEETEMCGIARTFARRLLKRANVTVHFVDESFSSDEAREIKEAKGPLDSSAACLILERYFKYGPLGTAS
jgi:putative Holliday junction resolvase